MISDIPKAKIEFEEHTTELDLDDPVLPHEIEERSLSAGGYPYSEKMKRKTYEHALEKLQLELVKVQNSLAESGERVVIVFEGRDTAGKGGTIERFRMNLSHRRVKTVALSKPTEIELGQWYFQRYSVHMPTDGEIILFDRSWYNRAGVEPVMGFCTPEQHQKFLKETPEFEKMLVNDGIHLFKFWLNIGQETQIKRFHDRRHSPLKSWKLSPLDIKAMGKWKEYTAARDQMLKATHTSHAPWTLIRSNDKKRARLNAIRHFLTNMEYRDKNPEAIGDIDPKIAGSGPSFLNKHGA